MSTTPYQQPATMPKQFDPPPQKSTGRTCLIGCLVVLLVMVLLCGCGGIWSYFYLGGIIVSTARNTAQQLVNESGMSEQDKREVMAQVDRVADAYQKGDIQLQDLGRVMEELTKSPVMASFMVFAIEEKYLKPSGLTEEEKASARLVLQRVMRGIVEKKIDPDSLDLAPVMESSGNQKKLKDKVTDEELREVLKKLEARADEAMIPAEPYEVRIGEEMKKAVDKALSPQG